LVGIDTNVLVRYLIRDDAEQTRRAVRFLEHECTNEDRGILNAVVLTELVWVLESVYRYQRPQIAIVIDGLLHTTQLKIEDSEDVSAALREYARGADFTDALIAAINRRLGCVHTVTFDRKAARRPGFLAL
jgi:predicted nucleic-acid-binding protein